MGVLKLDNLIKSTKMASNTYTTLKQPLKNCRIDFNEIIFFAFLVCPLQNKLIELSDFGLLYLNIYLELFMNIYFGLF